MRICYRISRRSRATSSPMTDRRRRRHLAAALPRHGIDRKSSLRLLRFRASWSFFRPSCSSRYPVRGFEPSHGIGVLTPRHPTSPSGCCLKRSVTTNSRAWTCLRGVSASMARRRSAPRCSGGSAERFGRWGFRASSLTPCYGMAEASLAVTFKTKDTSFGALGVDADRLACEGVVSRAAKSLSALAVRWRVWRLRYATITELRCRQAKSATSSLVGPASWRVTSAART